MSPKLPVISGRKAVEAFERIGYKAIRQRGSHIRLRDENNPKHLLLTIPDHEELKFGFLRKLIRDAGLTVDDFLKLLDK
jgi:predicted RNA binding protein YcfA (HicA-like mRNA interferase family)